MSKKATLKLSTQNIHLWKRTNHKSKRLQPKPKTPKSNQIMLLSSITAVNEEPQTNQNNGQTREQGQTQGIRGQPSRLTQLWHDKQDRMNKQEEQNCDTDATNRAVGRQSTSPTPNSTQLTKACNVDDSDTNESPVTTSTNVVPTSGTPSGSKSKFVKIENRINIAVLSAWFGTSKAQTGITGPPHFNDVQHGLKTLKRQWVRQQNR
uniref:Uncharacterized protein n=1 Tax=Panagrellus redivivus TaxID=6233 RepID=A0A7E4UVR2_PANRE